MTEGDLLRVARAIGHQHWCSTLSIGSVECNCGAAVKANAVLAELGEPVKPEELPAILATAYSDDSGVMANRLSRLYEIRRKPDGGDQ
jgi:hypothetical protein